jgi:hypothetical protein
MISCHIKHLESRCRQRGYTLDEVRACIVSQDGDQITVDETHAAYPRTAKPRSPASHAAAPKPPVAPKPLGDGPGSELKSLLAVFGIHSSPTCKCNAMARKMNEMEVTEPGWSLAHIEEVVDVMEETAKKRNLPFLRTAGRILVRKAVRNWQKKGTGK